MALVNNAQRAHVGMLGSVEAIARAKGEIYARPRMPSGIAVINADDPFATVLAGPQPWRRTVTFGFGSEGADVRATAERAPQCAVPRPRSSVAAALQVPGEHNVRNALAAARAALRARASRSPRCRRGSPAFAGVPGRLQRRDGAGRRRS